MRCPIWKIARLGQGDTTAQGFEQLMSEGFFKLAHLRTDGLDRHVQALSGTGKTTLFGDHPKVIQMSVIECGHGLSCAVIVPRWLKAISKQGLL